MDNVTHSLVGMATGEFLFHSQRAVLPKKFEVPSRSATILASVIANNLPDLDFFLSKLTPGPLGYILHHRGFTHTLVGAVPQGLFILGLGWLFNKFRKGSLSLSQILCLAATIFLGLGTHILADSWNNYGVHPFWPFNNKWYYGDAVFIAEPWIWATLIPVLFWTMKTKMNRLFFVFLLFGLGTVVYLSRMVPWPMMAFMSAWTAFLFFIFQFYDEERKSTVGLLILMLLVSVFYVDQRYVRFHTQELAWQRDPEAKLLDIIINPLPGNLICWSVITVETNGDPMVYKLQAGIFSTLPDRLTPEECSTYQFKNNFGVTTMPKKPNQDPRMMWTHSFKMSVEKLEKIYLGDCRVRAFFNFARAPFIQTQKGELTIGDYRYDRPGFPSFSQFVFPKGNTVPFECPKNVPPWQEPRSDLTKDF